MIMFNDLNLEENTNWEFSTFETEYLYNEDTPIISKFAFKQTETNWSNSSIKPSPKGIEIRNLIFRCTDYFDNDK